MKEEVFWILLSKKLSGEATPEELIQLQELIDANLDWGITSENLQEFWLSKPISNNHDQSSKDAYLSHIGRLKNLYPEFESHSNEILNINFKIHETKEHEINCEKRGLIEMFSKSRNLVLTSIFIFFILIIGIQWFKNNETNQQKHVSNNLSELTINPGSKSKITLSDGTIVWINSGSKLNYAAEFNGKFREVFLNGEAYFEVKKNLLKPFIVHTSGIDIKVLGTAFNVKAFDIEPTIETTLIHGSVEIMKTDDPNGTVVLLKPHEKLVYKKVFDKSYYTIPRQQLNAEQIKSLTLKTLISVNPLKPNIPDSAIKETAWIQNKFVFEDETFAELSIKMERWYNIKITINDQKLRNYRVSGSFVDETAEQALNELKILIPFNYKLKNNEFIIMK